MLKDKSTRGDENRAFNLAVVNEIKKSEGAEFTHWPVPDPFARNTA
jgi:hypothetical protein